jgi:DNA-binding response OmpR family regulator
LADRDARRFGVKAHDDFTMTVARRILVVDDNHDARASMRVVLTDAGYIVLLADSFDEGREAIATLAPDLLIVDVRLGAFNGIQLVSEAAAGLPCIVTSGIADNMLELDALQLGSYFVVRPVPGPVLLGLVDQALAAADLRQKIGSRRRWNRKTLAGPLDALIDSTRTARIVDVSYSGLRLELDDTSAVAQWSNVTVRDRELSVNVMFVWKRRTDDRMVCGAVLSSGNAAAVHDWVTLVDQLV